MLLEFIVRYYKVFWIVFGMIAFVKVIFAYVFHGGLQGINGVIFALFKWFNEEEQEIEDVPSRRTMMRVLNIITLIVYGVMLFLLLATLLPMFLPH
jgi:preprotein translocase subunit SecE